MDEVGEDGGPMQGKEAAAGALGAVARQLQLGGMEGETAQTRRERRKEDGGVDED